MAELVVTLEEGADSRAVAARLARHGFVLAADLGAIAVLTGEGDSAAISAMAAEPGVRAVEENPPMRIAGGSEGPGAC